MVAYNVRNICTSHNDLSVYRAYYGTQPLERSALLSGYGVKSERLPILGLDNLMASSNTLSSHSEY